MLSVKTLTWWKIYILSYWYHVKVWIILFSDHFTWTLCDTGIRSYWCSKAIKNVLKHKNYGHNFLNFAVSPCVTSDRFSQITSHIWCWTVSQKKARLNLQCNTAGWFVCLFGFFPLFFIVLDRVCGFKSNKIKNKNKRT